MYGLLFKVRCALNTNFVKFGKLAFANNVKAVASTAQLTLMQTAMTVRGRVA